MIDTDWLPCSDRSRERADPLVATGSRGLAWFLVEVDGPWGPNAFATSALGRQLGQALVTRLEAAGLRPLAIRRTGRREPAATVRWRWAFVDSRVGLEQVRWGEVDDPQHLLDIPLDGSAGTLSDAPIYCVCTHAKHDQCCAVRGRPVVAELAAAFPDETWECSHLGGDRFAGTMVVLPEGLYYGRLDDADVVDIVERSRQHRVDERFFRGRSSLSHPVQAAQHYARVAFDDDGLLSFPLVFERALGGPDGRTVVGLAANDGQDVLQVVVAQTLSEPLLSTCSATRYGRVREFTLESLDLLERADSV